MNIYFDELYRYDRLSTHANIAIPFAKGSLKNLDGISIMNENAALPLQSKVTATWDDGSVKWGFFRFITDLKKFSKTTLTLSENGVSANFDGIKFSKTTTGYKVDTGAIEFSVADNCSSLFTELTYNNKTFKGSDFSGPYLSTRDNVQYDFLIDTWSVTEEGPLVTILSAKGRNIASGLPDICFEISITAFAGKSHLDIAYRIINTTPGELKIKKLAFDILFNDKRGNDLFVVPPKEIDSTGCGDITIPLDTQTGPVLRTMGTTYLNDLVSRLQGNSTRVCVGASNYRTEFYVRNDGGGIYELIDSDYIIKEANEHYPETFYGTFFTDRTDNEVGISATIYQAQQNYPKAVMADDSKIRVMIVPDCHEEVIMQSGMARTQRFMLNFHEPDMTIAEIDNQSLLYQMPDKPYISSDVYKNANVFIDIFTTKKIDSIERTLINHADGHARAFGMLNFGDAPDPGYTSQNRGNGEPVWTNNEYDFPHACALIYAKTGFRRFIDYMNVAAEHWMDVDICHYSDNPLLLNGQWEHTNGHCKNGNMVCSHEWVEGLLDYYHFNGDKRALDSAIAIGHNVLRILETPMFKQKGEINARETGWALRTLVALYTETHDEAWLEKCEWIVGHFRDWENEYGHWLSPYTDNTAIRVPFMISIAVGSLMRYYRIRPNEEIKEMILRAVDDMVENCIIDTGVFYYKQLPSLNRLGSNTLVLEALTIAYELTGNLTYLEKGLPTLAIVNGTGKAGALGTKKRIGDTVLAGNGGTKTFGQCFIPISCFYKAIAEAGLGNEL